MTGKLFNTILIAAVSSVLVTIAAFGIFYAVYLKNEIGANGKEVLLFCRGVYSFKNPVRGY